MKCSFCNTENPNDAKYCRHCGNKLEGERLIHTNVMDRFPKYNFVPTNLIDWKKPWFAKIRTILFSIILAISIIMSGSCIVSYFSYDIIVSRKDDSDREVYYADCYPKVQLFDFIFRGYDYSYSFDDDPEYEVRRRAIRDYRGDIIPFFIISGVFSLLSLLFIIYGRRKYPAKNNQLNKIADYVQKYRYSGFIHGRKAPILRFYVKDNRMGLLDVAHYCVFLPAHYDILEWREKNKYLYATVDNKKYIIDINGREIK